MKSIILSSVSVLLIIPVFVSAAMNIIRQESNVKAYSVEIPVVKGWHLIASGLTFASDLNYLDETGDIKKKDIKAVYVYSNKVKDYISNYPKYDERLYSAGNYFNGDEKDIIGQANWVYVDKSGILKYKTKGIKTIDSTKLFSGYNFISITTEYIGKKLDDIKGTCNLEKAWTWEAEHQKWVNLLKDSEFYSGAEGAGMIIKVSSDCAFGSAVPAIPQIPD